MYKKLSTPRHANESVNYRAKCDDEDCTTSARVKVQPKYDIKMTLLRRDWLVKDPRQSIGRPETYCPEHAAKHETKEDREAQRKRQKRRS